MSNSLAIWISITSAMIASLALGWNIYRDVVFRARAKLSLSIVQIVHTAESEHPPYISFGITNFGPGPLIVSSINARRRRLRNRLLRRGAQQWAYIIEDYTNPLSCRLPKKLEVGEQASLLLPFEADCLLKNGFTDIGLRDTFGRMHWANRRDLKAVHKAYRDEFHPAEK
jgi:hypothetical protein